MCKVLLCVRNGEHRISIITGKGANLTEEVFTKDTEEDELLKKFRKALANKECVPRCEKFQNQTRLSLVKSKKGENPITSYECGIMPSYLVHDIQKIFKEFRLTMTA